MQSMWKHRGAVLARGAAGPVRPASGCPTWPSSRSLLPLLAPLVRLRWQKLRRRGDFSHTPIDKVVTGAP